MKPLIIVQTGHAPESIRARLGDFPQWFRRALRWPTERMRVIDVEAGAKLPPPSACAGAVITGSAAMVTDRARWSEDAAAWIRAAMDIDLPLFGVCYGHQLMAHALGGRVEVLPGGREIGDRVATSTTAAATAPLLRGSPPTWRAHFTHVQAVLGAPRSATILAATGRDPHQSLGYGAAAFSTQAHPEFSAQIMRAYILRRAEVLRTEGFDVAALLAEIGPTPDARALLRRFAHSISASADEPAPVG